MDSSGSNTLSRGDRAADRLTIAGGSWPAVFIFTGILAVYMLANSLPWVRHFDPYPFAFMTFTVSIYANYQAMFLQIGQRSQLMRDRKRDEETRVILIALLQLAKAQKTASEEAKEHDEELAAKIEQLLHNGVNV